MGAKIWVEADFKTFIKEPTDAIYENASSGRISNTDAMYYFNIAEVVALEYNPAK